MIQLIITLISSPAFISPDDKEPQENNHQYQKHNPTNDKIVFTLTSHNYSVVILVLCQLNSSRAFQDLDSLEHQQIIVFGHQHCYRFTIRILLPMFLSIDSFLLFSNNSKSPNLHDVKMLGSPVKKAFRYITHQFLRLFSLFRV